MAPNKFATMLHKNSNKMTIILVYAALEWVLIVLLLLNSLFWYLICKFAKYFGLKPPCLWCSRIDHFLELNDNRYTYRYLICEEHGTEISRLSYCSSHNRLAESQNMCVDCLSICNGKFIEMSPKVAFFTWVGENVVENDQENCKCSCCEEIMSTGGFSLYPSWGVVDYAEKNHLIAKVLDNEGENLDKSKSDFQEDYCKNEFIENSEIESFSFGSIVDIAKDNNDTEFNDKSFVDDAMIQIFHRDDESLEVMNLSLRNSECCDFDRLIPVELIDSSTVTRQRSDINVVDDVVGKNDHLKGENDFEPPVSKQPGQSPAEEEEPCDLFGYDIMDISDQVPPIQSQPEEQTPPLAHRLNSSPMDNEEVKIITDLDASMVQKGPGATQVEKAITQGTTVFTGSIHSGINHNLAANESEMVEEENSPLASAYMKVEQQLTKKKELEAEESWDGSVTSEVQGDDGALTIERLKSELEAERKSLRSLQAELEEDRNAAAIAANQTMAMITRLQEEKSAMQMEALHYQRMMEEQSEYDQEALQLLNDLIIKREKEKQELEKELEMCQKKVLDYEAKERMMIKKKCRSVRSRNSNASSINIDDNDELFIDLIHEEKGDDGSIVAPKESSNDNNHGEVVLDMEETGLDSIKHMSVLDESIAEFEDERMSILEELKALEQKLFTLADDDEHLFEDIKLTEHFTDAYGQEFDGSYKSSRPDENGFFTKFSEDLNGEGLLEKKSMGSTAKRLLPLFDEAGFESEEGEGNDDVKSQSTSMQIALLNKYELENNKVTIEEEVDHVYERLHALEADKEFLKHCFSSLKKGDKGMDLLEEILEHLRDLRTVELRVRNCGDSPLTFCSS